MITFKKVTKIYESDNKQVAAVKDVDLHVEKGHICVLLGPSGCGKTTLLRMVNRLIPITSGKIEVDGKDINTVDPIQLRRSIGYVIQQNGLFPNMTIEENIGIIPKLLGWDAERRRKRVKELLEMLGLNPDEYRDRYPFELSGGQQQRIGIARALAADPPIMLMDEPFGSLDPVIREHIQNEFLRIQATVKKTILFVSHDIDEAIKLGNTIAILKDGEVMQHGTPFEILSNPKNEFVKNFIGKDSPIKRLTLIKAKDVLKHKKTSQGKAETGELNSATVSADTDLKTALSILLSTNAGGVNVVDEWDRIVGELKLSDFGWLNKIHAADIGRGELPEVAG